jgi:hypothetical protein
MNILFLDYDGVINTPMWNEDGSRCRYGMPYDNKVNNFQAVQWVSEFCQKYNYAIVVTSTWRMDYNWKECLINGGLRDGIEILGRTRIMHDRGEEILDWLLEHPEVKNWLIFDDDPYDFSSEQCGRCVQTRPDVGFMQGDFNKAVALHKAFNKENAYDA